MASKDNFFFMPEETMSTPANGEAIVGAWWVSVPGKGLALWLDPGVSGLHSADPRPQCNASESTARHLSGHLGLPGVEVRQVPVAFMGHAVRQAAQILAERRERKADLKARQAEAAAKVPEVLSDAWKTMVADGCAKDPGRRTVAQREVIGAAAEMLARHGDDESSPVHSERDGRIALLASGQVRCLLSARDWQLYHETQDCRETVAALNAAVEDAHRHGADLADALAPVMEAHARKGADDTEPRAVLAWLDETLRSWVVPVPSVR